MTINNNYDDIINLPYYTSSRRNCISASDRAAQFSSFAALTGFEAEIDEAARFTDSRLEADDDRKSKIDAYLQLLIDTQLQQPEISVTYFIPDIKKEGGFYITQTSCFKRIDEYEYTLILTNGTKIPIHDIYDIENPAFAKENAMADNIRPYTY